MTDRYKGKGCGMNTGNHPPTPGSDLRGRDFSKRNLRGADLRGCLLADVNFKGADLTGADLRDSDLSGADFRSLVTDEPNPFFWRRFEHPYNEEERNEQIDISEATERTVTSTLLDGVLWEGANLKGALFDEGFRPE